MARSLGQRVTDSLFHNFSARITQRQNPESVQHIFLCFFLRNFIWAQNRSIENLQKLGVHRKLQRCVKFPNMMCLMSYGHNCELFLMLGLILSKLRGTIWQLNTTNELLFFLQEDPEQHRLVWSLNYDWLSNTHIAHKNDHCGHFIP